MKLKLETIESQINQFVRKLITKSFIKTVDKWARYQGKELEGFDVSIEDKGFFHIKSVMPKIIWDGDFTYHKSDTEKEEFIDKFAVSLIHNSSRFDDDNIVIITELVPECLCQKIRRIYIYSIRDKEDEDESIKHLPTFDEVKYNFENKINTCRYNSLIESDGYDTYTLRRFNYNSDRIFGFTAVYSDLMVLNSEFPNVRVKRK